MGGAQRGTRVMEDDENMTELSGSETNLWAEFSPPCALYPQTERLAALVRELSADKVTVLPGKGSDPSAAFIVLVNCLDSVDALALARAEHPGRPLVALVAGAESPHVVGALAAGASGIITLADDPPMWRDCMNVVLGGGRWFGGPGVDVSLDKEGTRYGVSRREDHSGDVTMRTRAFVSRNVKDSLDD